MGAFEDDIYPELLEFKLDSDSDEDEEIICGGSRGRGQPAERLVPRLPKAAITLRLAQVTVAEDTAGSGRRGRGRARVLKDFPKGELRKPGAKKVTPSPPLPVSVRKEARERPRQQPDPVTHQQWLEEEFPALGSGSSARATVPVRKDRQPAVQVPVQAPPKLSFETIQLQAPFENSEPARTKLLYERIESQYTEHLQHSYQETQSKRKPAQKGVRERRKRKTSPVPAAVKKEVSDYVHFQADNIIDNLNDFDLTCEADFDTELMVSKLADSQVVPDTTEPLVPGEVTAGNSSPSLTGAACQTSASDESRVTRQEVVEVTLDDIKRTQQNTRTGVSTGTGSDRRGSDSGETSDIRTEDIYMSSTQSGSAVRGSHLPEDSSQASVADSDVFETESHRSTSSAVSVPLSGQEWTVTGDQVIQIDGLPISADLTSLFEIVANFGVVSEQQTMPRGSTVSVRFRLNDDDACDFAVQCLHDSDCILPDSNNILICYKVL